MLTTLSDGSTLTGLFPAFWIQALQYPVAASTMVFVFAGCAYGLCRAPQAASAL